MKALAIDTTNTTLTVVVIDDEKSYYTEFEVGKSGHSALLIPEIKKVMDKANLTPDDLDVAGVVVGPGSFTGIRIGASAMTAISFSNGAKRVAVNYFELLAYSRGRITVGVDAGHGNTYLATCENGKILETRFVEEADKGTIPSDTYYDLPCPAHEVLESVLREKIERGEYVDLFEPVYMRKSQAERNLK